MSSLTDTQNSIDNRNIDIDRVGIKNFKLPIQLVLQSGIQHTVAEMSMYVYLDGKYRGTHMSRFIQLISNNQKPINAHSMRELTQEMRCKLEARGGEIILKTSLFLNKEAPATKMLGIMDYDVTYHTKVFEEKITQCLEVKIPTTALCPCSKEISDYGAHNQRSIITILVEYIDEISPQELIQIAEKSASCELYSVLKRPDEKYVTEYAYTHPKFVEDIVRDIYNSLKKLPNITAFKVNTENFESIHNHSAYAEIVS